MTNPKAFTIPKQNDGELLPRHLWNLDQLNEHISNLQVLQDALISEQIQHLHELATLSRMADALAHQRNFDQVVHDLVTEVIKIEDCVNVWMVESRWGEDDHVHKPDEPVIGPCVVPREVTLLSDFMSKNPASGWKSVRRKSRQDDHCFLGIPVVTNRHMVGTLVLEARDDLTQNEATLHLIQGIVRQTAVACENDRLVQAAGEMMVETVYGFATAIESRDPYTGGHTQRVTAYALLLAKLLGFSDNKMAVIRLGGLLHDIGKVAIPDAILRKQSPLTDEEFAIIRQHPVTGHQILKQVPQLSLAMPLVRSHHERWDGRGYPDGLAGEAIPDITRVLSIADSYDAMTSDRPYRKGMSHAQAIQEIQDGAGSQFDPTFAAVFSKIDQGELGTATEQFFEWCQSHDRSGAIDIAGLLQLGMPRIRLSAIEKPAEEPLPTPESNPVPAYKPNPFQSDASLARDNDDTLLGQRNDTPLARGNDDTLMGQRNDASLARANDDTLMGDHEPLVYELTDPDDAGLDVQASSPDAQGHASAQNAGSAPHQEDPSDTDEEPSSTLHPKIKPFKTGSYGSLGKRRDRKDDNNHLY